MLIQASVQKNDKKERTAEELSAEAQAFADAHTSMVDQLFEQLTIAAQRGCGKGKQVRYSAGLMKLALALVTRSKKGYQELQKTMQLPSIPLLMKKRQAMKTCSGSCPKVYRDAFNRNACKGAEGVLVLDEMQLAGSGLLFSSTDHRIVGFADEALNFESIFDPPAAKESSIAVYVNQFMFKSVDPECRLTFMGEYFYSFRSIAGNEIRAQILHVIRHLELAGFHVHGICLDAGGGNASAVTQMREKAHNCTTEEYWLGEEWVGFVHPTNVARRIFIWYCSAHGKCSRATRNFIPFPI
jgi:hypothetical protein